MSIWDIVSGAPWWVYVLFVYLMFIGIKTFEPRTVSIRRMVIFPLIFVAWSLMGLFQKVTLGFPSLIVYWCIFLALGAYLGMKEVHSWKYHIDHKKGLITIPGNYSTVVLILLIFVLKFVWGYFYATETEVSFSIYLADTITSAVFTGFFVGRAGFFIKKYMKN